MKKLKLIKYGFFYILTFILVFIIIPSTGIILYELHGFESHLPELDMYIYQAKEKYNTESAIILNIVNSDLDMEQMDLFLSRQFLAEFGGDRNPFISWKIDSFMWYYLFKWKIDKGDRVLLYLHYLPYKSEMYGLENAAIDYYNKDYKKLKNNELILLYLLSKRPNYYEEKPFELDKELKRYEVKYPAYFN